MDMAFVQQVVLPVVYVAVGVALIWALVELIVFLRRTSKTVSHVEEQVQPILADAKSMTEDLKPAIEKIDPLIDRASLAIDAANLEIMRIDGILEDISSITDTAARAVEAADSAAQTPMRLVNEAANKLRSAFSGKNASDMSAQLGASGEAAITSALGQGASDSYIDNVSDVSSVADAACDATADAVAHTACDATVAAASSAAQSECVYTTVASADTTHNCGKEATNADLDTSASETAKVKSKYFTY